MPLTIPVGSGVANFQLNVAGDDGPMFLTLGVRPVVAPFTAQHANALRTAFVANVMPILTLATKFRGVTVRIRGEGGGDDVFTSTPVGEISGGISAPAIPQNSAYVVRKRTGRAGRRGVGRWFVPGVAEGAVDDSGNIGAGTISALNAGLAGFLGKLAAPDVGNGDPVVPLLLHGNAQSTSRTSGGGVTTITVTQGNAGPLPDVITAMDTDPRLGSQRRRLR